MAKSFIYCLFVFLFATPCMAQTARVTIKVAGPKGYNGYIGVFDPSAKYDASNRGEVGIGLDAMQTAAQTFNITEPQYVSLSFQTNTNYYSYPLFISPGDDLTFKIDFTKKDNGIIVTGKGSNNNQPSLSPLTDIFTSLPTPGNLPYQAIAAINKQSKINKTLLNNYIARYKPSAAFIKNAQANIAYYAPVKFYYLKTGNMDPARNTGSWQRIQDSLFATIKLNNDDALNSYTYRTFLPYFLTRQKEKGWNESQSAPKDFYKKWYHTNVAEGKKIFESERKNLFIEKIINQTFTGKTAEFLYSSLLRLNLMESNTENIGVIFQHFKQRYPNSKYISWYSGPVNAATQRQSQTLNDKMIFVANNGSKLNTLKQVLAISKGKTVLIDMWGTWCSPCREEIEAHSAALREHFKGKNITFMYVANFDQEKEKEWKKLIAYFHLEGTHILANDKLTKDIMSKVKASGYPTYIIVKKDGTYALSKTQHPVNRQAMISELEAAIAM